MHAWRRTSLIDSRTEVLARTIFDNLSVINNDCGARAGDSRSKRTCRDRRIRLIPVLSVLHPFFFAAASSLVGSRVCSCHAAFSVCGSSGTSGTRSGHPTLMDSLKTGRLVSAERTAGRSNYFNRNCI